MKATIGREVRMNRGYLRRTIAGLLLGVMTAWIVMPLPVHGRGSSSDCHSTASQARALSSGGTAPAGCDHGWDTSCAAMVGCGQAAPALVSDVRPVWSAPLAATAGMSTVVLHGRLALGPPSPPPNS